MINTPGTPTSFQIIWKYGRAYYPTVRPVGMCVWANQMEDELLFYFEVDGKSKLIANKKDKFRILSFEELQDLANAPL